MRGRCLPYGDGITFWPLPRSSCDAAPIGDDDCGDAGLAKLEALTGDREVTMRLASLHRTHDGAAFPHR